MPTTPERKLPHGTGNSFPCEQKRYRFFPLLEYNQASISISATDSDLRHDAFF